MKSDIVEDIYKILNDHIEEHRNKKFEYGNIDCGLFAVSFVKKITGDKSHYENYYKKYSSMKSLLKRLKDNGYENLKDYFDKNFKERNINFAQRGDIVMIENCVGLCNGIDSFFLTEQDGLTNIKTELCDNVWRVK